MRRILSTFSKDVRLNFVSYFVEAFRNRRWREVAGPYNTEPEAEAEAIRYGNENNCKTRVVAEN
jgi:hypothetical protein